MPIPNNFSFESLIKYAADALKYAFKAHNPFKSFLRGLTFGVYNPSSTSSTSSNGGWFSDGLSNLWNGVTGSSLTDAQKEANEFTHNERIEAQDWSAYMDSTKLQRGVADARAAGINPMMIAGGGSSAPSSNGGQSVAPSQLQLNGLMSMISTLALLPSQKKVLDSTANRNNAAAKEHEAKVPFWEMSTQKALEQIEQIRAQTTTEGAKAEFYEARSYLANVTADNIKYLQEAVKNYYEASANAANASAEQSQAAAFCNYVQACYQAKLMDSGYIEQLVKRTAAETADAYASAGEHRAGAVLKDKQGNLVDVQTHSGEIANSMAQGTFLRDYASDGQNMDFFTKWSYMGSRIMSPIGSVFHVGINN